MDFKQELFQDFKLRKVESQLTERKKELTCLYKFAELIERKNIDLTGIFTEIVHIIPPSFRYPKETSAILVIDTKEYQSEEYRESDYRIENSIIVDKKQMGYLRVCYGKKISETSTNPFLKEEEELLAYLCERLGRVIQRYSINTKLERANSLLQTQYETLEKKTIALSELLDHLQYEKEKGKKQIRANVDTIILPILDKMRTESDPKSYIDIVISSLNDLTSTFSINLKNNLLQMTPREIEICNLLKNGLTSKEIGNLLSVSSQTISKHRFHIRKKLGIKNKNENIVTILKAL